MADLSRLGIERPTDYKLALLLIELLVFASEQEKFSSREAIYFFSNLGVNIHIRTMQRMIKRLTEIGLIAKPPYIKESSNKPNCGQYYCLSKKIGELELDKISKSRSLSKINLLLYIIKDSSQKNDMRLSTSFVISVFNDCGFPIHKRKAQRMLADFFELGIIDIVSRYKPKMGESIFIVKSDFFKRVEPILKSL